MINTIDIPKPKSIPIANVIPESFILLPQLDTLDNNPLPTCDNNCENNHNQNYAEC
jgi:hypothetical protein